MANEPSTREAYRQQKEAAEAAFKQRDQERLRTEREYARQKQKAAFKAVTEDAPEKKRRREKKEDLPAVKRLKTRLNWAIGITFGLIIIVYLILFFL